jgi:DNA-binding transcriptional LysR family regulator
MELRHLRYFAAVAEELHFARAAARLNIAAPTLSHQIRALETMLGAKLFTRKTESAVSLTNSGKRFLAEAQETLKQAAHAEKVGRQAGRGEAGSISLGYVLSASCGGLVSPNISSFRVKPTIADGMCAGPKIAIQVPPTRSIPLSVLVGTSGRNSTRSALVTASTVACRVAGL